MILKVETTKGTLRIHSQSIVWHIGTKDGKSTEVALVDKTFIRAPIPVNEFDKLIETGGSLPGVLDIAANESVDQPVKKKKRIARKKKKSSRG